jgi:tetratricopeptide (TPR) repeat protein
MELVHGAPLLRYADSNKLDTSQRLDLLADMCDAVQHAHQRGVIHRDLKPDNILIDESGGAAHPKILDFGVARVVDPESQTTTLHTSAGQIIGTIAYMSPEQASGQPSEIDTRSDVYALGVISYQLLCGQLPYRINLGNIAESVRTIVQDDPTPLSSVDRSLRGDVTTIVGKALEKDKSRRYASAAEMASDIRRCLKHEPISAHPPSTMYQLGKFARRNKGLVTGIATAFVVLVLGIVGTGIGLIRERHAKLLADLSAAEARSEADKQAAVTSFLQQTLASANPRQLSATDRAKGLNVTVIEALREAGRKLDAGSLMDQPRIELAVRATIASTCIELAELELAEHHAQAALSLARDFPRSDMRELARALNIMSILRRAQGKFADAETFSREALQAMRVSSVADDDQSAEIMNNLSLALLGCGKYAEAGLFGRDALNLARKVHGENHSKVAIFTGNLGTVYIAEGNLQAAETCTRDAVTILRSVLGQDHPDVARALNNLADALQRQGKYAEAETISRESLAMRRKFWGEVHPDIANALVNLAWVLQKQEKYDQAETLYTQAIEMQLSTAGEENPAYANYLANLVTLQQRQGKYEQAEQGARRTLEIRRKLLGENHPSIGQSLNSIALAIASRKNYAEAEPIFRQSLAIYVANLGEDHPDTANEHMQLGACLFAMKKYDQAESELLAAHRVLKPMLGTNRNAAVTVGLLVKLYNATNQPQRAAEYAALLPSTRLATTGSVNPAAQN